MASYICEVSSYLLCGVCVVVWFAHALRVRTPLRSSWDGGLTRTLSLCVGAPAFLSDVPGRFRERIHIARIEELYSYVRNAYNRIVIWNAYFRWR